MIEICVKFFKDLKIVYYSGQNNQDFSKYFLIFINKGEESISEKDSGLIFIFL